MSSSRLLDPSHPVISAQKHFSRRRHSRNLTRANCCPKCGCKSGELCETSMSLKDATTRVQEISKVTKAIDKENDVLQTKKMVLERYFFEKNDKMKDKSCVLYSREDVDTLLSELTATNKTAVEDLALCILTYLMECNLRCVEEMSDEPIDKEEIKIVFYDPNKKYPFMAGLVEAIGYHVKLITEDKLAGLGDVGKELSVEMVGSMLMNTLPEEGTQSENQTPLSEVLPFSPSKMVCYVDNSDQFPVPKNVSNVILTLGDYLVERDDKPPGAKPTFTSRISGVAPTYHVIYEE
jgi:hypothetical protein